MIKVEENKNILFLTAIINTIFERRSYSKKAHPLGKKIYAYITKNTSLINKVKTEYENLNPLQTLYQYMQLGLYLDEEFNFSFTNKEKKKIDSISSYKKHKDIIEKDIQELYKTLKYQEYFTKEIASEYEILSNDIQNQFSKVPQYENVLTSFWEIDTIPELVFIPNITAIGDCFGIMKRNTFNSITAPRFNKESNQIEYSDNHVYSNSLHEFSHQFFKKKIEKLNLKDEVERLIKQKFEQTKLKNEVKKIYDINYFEECLIKSSTVYLKEELGMYKTRKEIDKALSQIEDGGYFHSKTFYEALQKNAKPLEIFLSTLKEI
jgi:hypothetical protein